jgi:membrane protease YdiL (CAAX protease family)
MLQNYSKSKKILLLFAMPLWVFVSFFVAQILLVLFIWVLRQFLVPIGSVNETILNTVASAVIYVIALVITIGLPWYVLKRRTTLADIGLNTLPTWTNILIAPAGLIVYLILSAILISLAVKYLPWFNINEVQDVGFDGINKQYEYILAFITLVVIAPFAEEILFRGYLYGKLKKIAPIWVAILFTSILFGLVHGAWNLAIDTFALSIIMCLMREITGNIWSSILLHMMKNGIAFYILFINPAILTTLVR